MNFTHKKLTNGLTLMTVPMKDNLSVTVLVMVRTGSKYETKENNGLSHFLEHMMFKGTTKRPKPSDIAIELDSIGSQSNAFTGHEFTGYFAKAEPKHLSTIIDVVSDIYLNSVFAQTEIDKEKGVIVGEINMYEDLPQHVAHKIFMETLYGDQPAGWDILGPKKNILKINRDDFQKYWKDHYVASATTVIVSGNFDEKTIEQDIEKAFVGTSTESKHDKVPVVEIQTKPNLTIKQKETDQTHMVLGVRAFNASDPRLMQLKVLSVVLGGGMSSRLFQKLREEMGVGYYVRSGVDEFTDHGYLAVSTGIDTTRIVEVVKVILEEFKKLTTDLVPQDELQKSKDFMIGNMFLGLESSDSLAEYYVVQDMLGEEIITPTQVAEKIRNVTAEEIQLVAQEIFTNEKLNMAAVGNITNAEEIKNTFSL